MVGAVLFMGAWVLLPKLHWLRGELAGFGRGLECAEATRMAGGGMGMSVGR